MIEPLSLSFSVLTAKLLGVQIFTVMILIFGQIGLGKHCRPRSDCSWRSSLIRVFTVCYTICIFLMKYPKVWPTCLNFT